MSDFFDPEKRILYLSDDVDENTMGNLGFQLLLMLRKDEEEDESKKNYKREPIRIYINSGGGDIYDMWGFIDLIETSKTPIYTYCTGYAMSAAFMIFIAGHKRYAYENSTFLYHQPYHYRWGKYQDLVEDREQMDYLYRKQVKYVKSRTKITQDMLDVNRERKQDWYIHADEALKLGIVDEILKGRINEV